MTSLTDLPALDVAIGLSFIFLVLSLLASAVHEWFAAILALRSRTLEQGLISMLNEADDVPPSLHVPDSAADAPARNLVEDLYGHPLIRSLYRKGKVPFKPKSDAWKKGRLPSYISPRAFAVALTDILSASDQAGKLRENISSLNIPAAVKYRLLTVLGQAGDDLQQFRTHLEMWFDDTMARVSGWYKRQSQIALLVIGVVVVIALNANSVTMAERLWKDPTVRAAVVAQAAGGNVGGQTSGGTPQQRLNTAADNVDSVTRLGVPLGWSSNHNDPRHVSFNTVGRSIAILAGWLLTIGAISLGAPFWFDTLSRLSRLRSSGKPETPLPASSSGKPNERITSPI
jgi:hypothetical protein